MLSLASSWWPKNLIALKKKKTHKNVIRYIIFITIASGGERREMESTAFPRPLPSLQLSQLLQHLLITNSGYLLACNFIKIYLNQLQLQKVFLLPVCKDVKSQGTSLERGRERE